MPRKPKFTHPLRAIRGCLGYTQAAFAKFIGCSAITIQRIENGSLPISRKLAYAIMEATGADPVSIRAGGNTKPFDMLGQEYSKASLDFYQNALPIDEREFRYLVLNLAHYIQLMLIAANRGRKFKAHAVFSEIQESFVRIAGDFSLTGPINNFLVENGHVERRKYRVSDLRKFPDFARLIGYKDDKRFSANKIIPYDRPKGWIPNYVLIETPVLPPDAEMKLRPDADYYIDNERPIPEEFQKIIDQALYWKINEFRWSFVDPPQTA